jgi:hypothetical protein
MIFINNIKIVVCEMLISEKTVSIFLEEYNFLTSRMRNALV